MQTFGTMEKRRRKKMGSSNEVTVPSPRWKEFSLQEAWWSLPLARGNRNTRDSDYNIDKDGSDSSIITEIVANTDAIVESVKLSPGSNKYVLARGRLNKEQQQQVNSDDFIRPSSSSKCDMWFVRSASPHECGGVYHSDVAQTLKSELLQHSYKITSIQGGGRIEYDPIAGKAHVFGFSYGYGRGDHKLVSRLIKKHCSDVIATFDDSDDLY